jgi:hypothetical protein
METITINFIYGTCITILVLSYGFFRGVFYFKDMNNQSHIYDSNEIQSIIRGG